MDRAAKSELIAELDEVFKASERRGGGSLFRPDRRPDADSAKADEAGGRHVKVAKNRLAKIALEGTDVASIAPLLKGPTLIAFSGDPVAAPKVAVDFAKAHEQFVILGGAMGKTALDPNGVKALASLPSLDELRAKIVGLLRGAGDQDRAAGQRPCGQGRARGPGLCLQER